MLVLVPVLLVLALVVVAAAAVPTSPMRKGQSAGDCPAALILNQRGELRRGGHSKPLCRPKKG